MFRRLTMLFVFGLALSLMLVACGDEAAPVPTYTGSTSITAPDSLKSQFTGSFQGIKNATLESFKTGDELTKVKSGFETSFKNGGWKDGLSKYAKADDLKTIESAGMFVLAYEKGNKGAVIMGMPGTVANAVGFTGIKDNETVYVVMSGNE